MEQEQKQITTADVLRKLYAQTDDKGDFYVYRSEIEKLQSRMSALLGACREVARGVEKTMAPKPEKPIVAAPEAAPVKPVNSEEQKPAVKPAPPVQAAQPSQPVKPAQAAQPTPATKPPVVKETKKYTPAATGQKTKPVPNYVRGMANVPLRPEPRKKPAAQQGKPPYRPDTKAPAERPASSVRLTTPPPSQISATKPRKTGEKKKDAVKPFEEKKAMTKRTLIRKGFIQDDRQLAADVNRSAGKRVYRGCDGCRHGNGRRSRRHG